MKKLLGIVAKVLPIKEGIKTLLHTEKITCHEHLDRSVYAEPILILGEDSFSRRRLSSKLVGCGFTEVVGKDGYDECKGEICFEDFNLIFFDFSSLRNLDKLLVSAELSRLRGGNTRFVPLSSNPTYKEVYRCGALGVSDFLIAGPYLDIQAEASQLIRKKKYTQHHKWVPDHLRRLGLFRSVGLTQGEIEIIVALANGFPRQCEIADSLGKSGSYINKTFSRIYEKMNDALSINNPAKLAHLITVCSFFR